MGTGAVVVRSCATVTTELRFTRGLISIKTDPTPHKRRKSEINGHLVTELCFNYRLIHYHNSCRPKYRREPDTLIALLDANMRSQPTLQSEQRSQLSINRREPDC